MKKPIYAATLTVAVGLLVLPLISSRHIEDPSSEAGMEVEGELPQPSRRSWRSAHGMPQI